MKNIFKVDETLESPLIEEDINATGGDDKKTKHNSFGKVKNSQPISRERKTYYY